MQTSELQARARLFLWWATTDQVSDANLLASLNNYAKEANIIAIQANGKWEVNWEEALADLVSWTTKYAFPSDLVSLKRIEINFTTAAPEGSWEVVEISDLRSLPSLGNGYTLYTDDGKPMVEIYDTYFNILQPVTTNVTNGLKIYYSDDATTLSWATDEPSLYEGGQYYIIYGACFDYVAGKASEQYSADVSKFQNLLDRYEGKITKYYSNRLPASRTRFTSWTSSETYE